MGRDAGEFCGLAPVGITATRNITVDLPQIIADLSDR
jgi:hypothetical protein